MVSEQMTNSQVFSIKNVSTFPVSNFAQSHCIFFHTKSAGHFWMAWQKKVHMNLLKSHRIIAERFDHSCEFYKKNWPNSFYTGFEQGKKVCKATALRSCHCFPCTMLPGLNRAIWSPQQELQCSVVNSGGAL